MARRKSNAQPSRERYKSENRRLKNKVRKIQKHLKRHPNDKVDISKYKE